MSINTSGNFNGIAFAKNADFSQSSPIGASGNILEFDKQIWVGTTVANTGGTHVNVVTLTPGAGVTLTQAATTLTIGLTGGGASIDTIVPNSGINVVPDGSGSVSILGTGSITTVGTLNTETVQLTGLTNHALLVGAGTATITKIASGATGQFLQTNTSADPTWSTATLPSTATGTGKILRADGTNWVATTATFPDTAGTSGNILTSNGTNWTSAAPATAGTVTSVSGTANQVAVATGTTTPVISLIGPYTPATYTSHGVLLGAGTSSIVALAEAATGTVLTGVTGSNAAFSATPAVTSITLSGGTALSTYAEGTFTPTIAGVSTAGVTTYTIQSGTYIKIGKMVFYTLGVSWSAATGTGIIQIGGLPFAINVPSSVNPASFNASIYTNCLILTATSMFIQGAFNGTVVNLLGFIANTGATVNSSLAANTNNFLEFSGCYLATT